MRNRSAILGVALIALAFALWHFLQPPPSYQLRLSQLTFDPGLTASPAISPDGRMVAYASDRDTGSNLELYVQPIRGGSAVRLTTGTADISSVDFSPDGATLAYTAGGSVYTVPVSSGQPHLIAGGGPPARYSPDGRWIAASHGAGVTIFSAANGASTPFHPESQRSQAPSWSPDGASLAFWADEDLYVAPREGGAAQSAGIGPRLAKAGIGPGPFPDAVWTRYGLIFSARTGFTRNQYLCPLDGRGKSNGDIVRLTNGTELLGDPSVTREGLIVFSSGRQRFDIWGVPLDAASGKAKGPPYRITDTLAPTANPDISTDGRRLLFGSSRSGFTEIWEKDLDTGKEWVAATSPEGASYGRFLRSGGLLYVQPVAGHDEVYLGNRRVAVGTRPWDADGKAGTILVSGAGIDALDATTGRRVPLLRAPAQTTLSEASFSPDDRWVLFVAKTLQTSRIYVAPARGGDWLPITDSARNAGKPRFSPDGGLIYFTVDGEGTREIAAVRFDSQRGRALGEEFPVFRPAAARLSLHSVNPEALNISVARDKLVTILCEQTSTIWIGELVLQ